MVLTGRFLERRGGFNVYLKSASYLLHMPEFAAVRELILGSGRTILQDDSGVPLRHFDRERFSLRFFGTYEQKQEFRDHPELMAKSRQDLFELIEVGLDYTARDTVELAQIYRILDELEPTEQEQQAFQPRLSLYYWPLALALLIASMLLIGYRRGSL